MMPQATAPQQIQKATRDTVTAAFFRAWCATGGTLLCLLPGASAPYAEGMKNATPSPLSTPSAAATPAPQPQRTLSLEPSGQHLLWVTEGSELQGLSGPLQILLYPGQPDTRLPFRLQAGQGWRSPGTGWVSLHNPGATTCRGQWRMAP